MHACFCNNKNKSFHFISHFLDSGDLCTLRNAIDSITRPKYALLIGVQDETLLDGPVKNCALMKDALLQLDASWHISEVLGANATQPAITAAVKLVLHLVTQATPRYGCDGKVLLPVVLVYFAGHGLQLGTEQYLMPYGRPTPNYSRHGMV